MWKQKVNDRRERPWVGVGPAAKPGENLFGSFEMNPLGNLTAWIALGDVAIRNGCLQFIPGTHRYGKREPIRLGEDGDSVDAAGAANEMEAEKPEFRAGSATFPFTCSTRPGGSAIFRMADFVCVRVSLQEEEWC